MKKYEKSTYVYDSTKKNSKDKLENIVIAIASILLGVSIIFGILILILSKVIDTSKLVESAYTIYNTTINYSTIIIAICAFINIFILLGIGIKNSDEDEIDYSKYITLTKSDYESMKEEIKTLKKELKKKNDTD